MTWLVSDSPVNYRPVFLSERAPWKKNNLIVRRKKKSKIKSGQGSQKEVRYPDLLIDWLSAAGRTTTLTPSYKITNPQLSKVNFKDKEKLVTGPRWAPDTRTDWPRTNTIDMVQELFGCRKKPIVNRPISWSRCSWEDNIKTGHKGIRYEVFDQIRITEKMEEWRSVFTTVMTFWGCIIGGEFLGEEIDCWHFSKDSAVWIQYGVSWRHSYTYIWYCIVHALHNSIRRFPCLCGSCNCNRHTPLLLQCLSKTSAMS
jgi:hypothetical protein